MLECTLDQAVQIEGLARVIVLYFTLSTSSSTQLYKALMGTGKSNARGLPHDGLAYYPRGVEIILSTLWHSGWEKLQLYAPLA